MDKIVYVYGSGRDAATRALRHAALPRQLVVRLGPWTIRPARQTAIEFPRLAPFEDELFQKIQQGVIQVLTGDGQVISNEQLKAGFDALKGTPAGADYMTMPFAELMQLMRTERPTQAVWDAFVERSLTEATVELPDIATRVRGLMEYSPRVRALGLNTEHTDALLTEAQAKLDAAKAAERTTETITDPRSTETPKEPDAGAGGTETIPDPRKVETAPPPAEGETTEDPEKMDFSSKESETSTESTETKTEETASTESTTPPAEETKSEEPPVEAKTDAPARTLPDGWRELSNTKLTDLIAEVGAEMPAKANKANLISALEAWLGGS